MTDEEATPPAPTDETTGETIATLHGVDADRFYDAIEAEGRPVVTASRSRVGSGRPRPPRPKPSTTWSTVRRPAA